MRFLAALIATLAFTLASHSHHFHAPSREKVLSLKARNELTHGSDLFSRKSFCTYEDDEGSLEVNIFLAPFINFLGLCNNALTETIIAKCGGTENVAPFFATELNGCIMHLSMPGSALSCVQRQLQCLAGRDRAIPVCVGLPSRPKIFRRLHLLKLQLGAGESRR